MPNGSCVPSKGFPELNLSRQSSVKASPLCRLPPLPGQTMRHHIYIFFINGAYKPCTRYNLLGECTSTDKGSRGPFESPNN